MCLAGCSLALHAYHQGQLELEEQNHREKLFASTPKLEVQYLETNVRYLKNAIHDSMLGENLILQWPNPQALRRCYLKSIINDIGVK